MPIIVTFTINPAVDISTSVAIVQPAHKLRCAAPRRDPGGGGINVARVVTRFGADVLAVFTVGGRIGQHLKELVVTRDLAVRADLLPIEPVSTVGAGDSFLGAMVARLAAGRDLEDAFRYAVAAGSAALLTHGTELSRRDDVERLVGSVSVRKVDEM